MTYPKMRAKCPVCGKTCMVTRTWTKNKYKKVYQYYLYHHKTVTHYSNQSVDERREMKKYDAVNMIISTLNSLRLKKQPFTTREMQSELASRGNPVGWETIRHTLITLSQRGVIEPLRNGRYLSWYTPSVNGEVRHKFHNNKMKMTDTTNDASFAEHGFTMDVVNDNDYPLYFIVEKFHGSSSAGFQEINMKGVDVTMNENLSISVIEDAPKVKRVLISFDHPILPKEERAIEVRWTWMETGKRFLWSTVTDVDEYQLTMITKRELLVNATFISSNEHLATNASKLINQTTMKGGGNSYTLTIEKIHPHSYLEIKWKQKPNREREAPADTALKPLDQPSPLRRASVP